MKNKYCIKQDGVRTSELWFDTYEELLIHLKRTHDSIRRPYSYDYVKSQLSDFTKVYRHNENDGNWTKGYWTTKRVCLGVDENGRSVYETINDKWNPPVFTRKPLQVTDPNGRILNAKDLWKDWQNVIVPEEKPRRYYYRYRLGTGTGSRNGWWQKYKGDHNGPATLSRAYCYAREDQKECLDEYGVTFKVRSRHENAFNCLWDFYDRHRSKGRGWKRTRKEKQWM